MIVVVVVEWLYYFKRIIIDSRLRSDGVPICLGAAATDLGIDTAAGKRRCAGSQWKRIWKGR